MTNTQDKGMGNMNGIQRNIDHNMQNFLRAEEMLSKTTDEKMKRQIMDKNQRRIDAVNAMKSKIGESNFK